MIILSYSIIRRKISQNVTVRLDKLISITHNKYMIPEGTTPIHVLLDPSYGLEYKLFALLALPLFLVVRTINVLYNGTSSIPDDLVHVFDGITEAGATALEPFCSTLHARAWSTIGFTFYTFCFAFQG